MSTIHNFNKIGSRERSELVDYIMFNGAIPEKFGMKNSSQIEILFQILMKLDGEDDFQNMFMVQNQKIKNYLRITFKWLFIIPKTLDDVSTNIGTKIDPNVTNGYSQNFSFTRFYQ